MILYYEAVCPAAVHPRRTPYGREPVDTATVRNLIALNNRFYAEHAASFSATRTMPWTGWLHLADELRERGWAEHANTKRSVLDVACGNLRFERFLSQALPTVRFGFTAIDHCAELADAADTLHVAYRQLDILEALLDPDDEVPHLASNPHDLVVCFGFMHHVPYETLRQRVIDALVDATLPGGFIALSFWQFMNDERLATKAARAAAIAAEHPPYPGFSPAALDVHDHFLGWQDDPRPLRYCHHFPEQEIDALVAHAASRAHECTRWSADGSSGTLNRYLLLQRS